MSLLPSRPTFRERCQQTLDNVINTMRQYENKESMGIIFSGIKSQEPTHIANACEALSTLQDPDVARRITFLIENLSHSTNKTTHKIATEFNTVDKVLKWCRKRNDEWLVYCANSIVIN